MLDPCLNTVINDLNVDDMAAFASFTAISQISYNFTDSVDLMESTVDYCGSKQLTFTLPSGSTNVVTESNQGRFKFKPSSD